MRLAHEQRSGLNSKLGRQSIKNPEIDALTLARFKLADRGLPDIRSLTQLELCQTGCFPKLTQAYSDASHQGVSGDIRWLAGAVASSAWSRWS